ncbi:helicase-related protein [Micromonospora sp. NPDC007271]|uniref:helicase-related protein n=1 Tax=Micromonospora sp. NPDC007271 TaxID=3154587 RepID=UPI0033E12771
MSEFINARETVLDVLRRELVGPDPQGEPFDFHTSDSIDEEGAWKPRRQAGTGEEILTRDSPDRRYGIGVLYSEGARASGRDELPAGDGPPDLLQGEPNVDVTTDHFQDHAAKARESLTGEAANHDLDLSGANDFKPSTMAITFLIDLRTDPIMRLTLSAGRYQQREVRTGKQNRSWWFRSECSLRAEWPASALLSRSGMHRPNATSENLTGLDIEAFAVSRPVGDGTSLVTVGVKNGTSGSSPNKFLYQVAFNVSLGGEPIILPYPHPPNIVRDFEEESIDLLYRSLPTFAVGHGCAAGWTVDRKAGRCSEVRGEPLPVVETPSITPDIRRPDGSDLRVPMAPLAGLIDGDDGFGSLAEIVDLYEHWIQEREADSRMLGESHQETASRHVSACRQAAARMREGLDLIKNDDLVRRAFVLANKAVLLQQVHSVGPTRGLVYDEKLKAVRLSEPRRLADPLSPPPGRGAWRPFQIAFILATLPSCANSRHPDRELVELIFFPTGGGKTEAYLGLSAFTAFLRRLRNPADTGVEVLMRYTLRLLTAQQFQRASALVCAMERIRAETPELGLHAFTIGIWVGGETSPNTQKGALTDLRRLRSGQGPNRFLVIRCPWCSAQIGPIGDHGSSRRGKGPRILGYEEAGGSVRVSCTDQACEFASGLPLFVIDDDIYESRPTIVIGTVDKFAQLAWRPAARSLFGIGVDGEQEVSPPGLIIQDELHLISGPLGSMVGLYEAVIEELCVDSRPSEPTRPKIVSSTATIRRYAEQVKALFARERVELFPPHGIDAGDSFFARYATYPEGHERAGEVREGRMYVGIHGAGLGSLQTVQVRTFAALLQAGMDLPEEKRDPYWTLMVFFNSLRELGTSLSLLQSDIPDYLKVIRNRRGASWEDVRWLSRELELTGRLQNDEVPSVMEALEIRHGGGREAVDVCLASNIIEVGIDIDRLSLMTVVGQPKSTSQYIQVTGRVGRRWEERPGLVATIYSPSKPRDRSHYEKFRTYHERLYAQVEPTSVTPFAPPVLARALHAVLVAWVRQRSTPAACPYPMPAEALGEVADILRRRVLTVDPDEAETLERFLEQRIAEWQRWSPADWQRVGSTSEPGLLYPAGDYAYPEDRRRSWPTPMSLRNVDAECRGVITGIYALEDLK